MTLLVLFVCPIGKVDALQEPKIRVLITKAKEISFRADNRKFFSLKDLQRDNWQRRVKSLKIRVKNGQTEYFLNGNLQNTHKFSEKINLTLTTQDQRGIWLGKRRYGGTLLVKREGDKLIVINRLRLEKYLTSVVGAEMPKGWPIEALKAQAIAARTYALKQKTKQTKEYDIRATEQSQVYLGLESETPKIRRAVNTTRSLVMVYRGSLIDALFHSSSGGQTEDSGFVWGKKIAYLSSVKDFDQNSPNFQWTRRYTPVELRKAFPEIGGVNTIRVIDRSKSNRVLKALVYGSNDKAYYSGQVIRERLNLKSTLFNVSIIPEKLQNKETNYHKRSYLQGHILHDSGYPLPPPPPFLGKAYLPELPEIKRDNYSLLVKGSGAGHGVGMSQWGAKEMAHNGSNFHRILNHYYKGIKITKYSPRFSN